MKHCISKAWQISWMVCLALIPGLFTFPAFAGTSLEKDIVLIREYQDRISLTSREIYELKENLEWLELKITRMNNFETRVPPHLYESVSYKKLRINTLEQTRQSYTDCLKKITSRMPVQKTIPLETTKNSSVEQETENLIDQVKTSGLLDWFVVISDQNPDPKTLKIKTSLPILFASGSAVIPKAYDPFLKKVSSFIKDYKVWIVVDGFADEDPIKTKQFPSNLELGAIRAANVVHALVSHGLSPSVFKVASTGEYRFPTARKRSAQKAVERYVNITISFETS
ncbi:MAG: OmpA family protein [Desulfobacula sp.]|jgi:flagellar motor protein MotB|nr:OmpA family protein [Desulfobacula sp.]